MIRFAARIYLKTFDEGGMSNPGWSGMMPSFNITGELILCRIEETSGNKELPLGTEHNVFIELPYGEFYIDSITANAKFLLQLGGRVIGWGTVTGEPNPGVK
jgi:translation elongation factor EF-Tu-like GTPase